MSYKEEVFSGENSMIIEMAKKIIILVRKRRTCFYDIDKQKEILCKLKVPKDLIERSYFQYYCQMNMLPIWLRLCYSLLGVFLTPIYYLKFYSSLITDNGDLNKAILISGLKDISYVPKTLKKEYSQIIINDYNDRKLLGKNERRVLKMVYKKYWRDPYFCVKCMLKIALYAQQIYMHKPNTVITCSEYSFTSSILTYYCNTLNIEHVNIMHGEKLFDITDAFVGFNRFFVWDEHYKKLFIKLRADENQFYIEKPDFLKLRLSTSDTYRFELTYYLGGEDNKTLENICYVLNNLTIPANKICVRYHPRYSNVKQIKNIFGGNFNIENPYDISIKESLNNTKYVASLFSTVLYEAYVNGKLIIIDDLSNVKKYNQLTSLDYLMLNKPHVLMSELINANVDF